MNLELKIDRAIISSCAIAFVFGYKQLGNVIGVIVTSLLGPNSIDTAIQILLTLFCTGYVLLRVGRRSFIRNWCFVIILLCLFLITKFCFPQNYKYLSEDLIAIAFSVLGFLIVSSVQNIAYINSGLKILAYIDLFYAVAIGFNIAGIIHLEGFSTSYMEYGYNVLPAAVIFTYLYEKFAYRKYLVMAIISAFFILIFGSRGALLFYFVYIIVYNFFIKGILNKKFIGILLGATVMVLASRNLYFVEFVSSMLFKVFGISSRSLMKLLDGTITNNSGRDLLYEPALKLIRENWMFGTGVYSDRALIYMASDDINSVGYGHYVHNFFLELMMNFGIPIAIILIICYVYTSFRILKHASDESRWCYIIFNSLWFFKSLTSGSYWTIAFFWGSVALLYVLRWEQQSGANNKFDNI